MPKRKNFLSLQLFNKRPKPNDVRPEPNQIADDIPALPVELIDKIIGYLDLKSTLSMRCVSKAFKKVVEHEQATQPQCFLTMYNSLLYVPSALQPGEKNKSINFNRYQQMKADAQWLEIQIVKEWKYTQWCHVDAVLKDALFNIEARAETMFEVVKNDHLLESIHNDLIYSIACDKIDLSYLNLSGLSLTRLPVMDSLDKDMKSKWGMVRILDLSSNSLKLIPKQLLSYIPELTALYLNNNQLIDIPLELANVKSLSQLRLSYNQITEITYLIATPPDLLELTLDNNQLSKESLVQFQTQFPNKFTSWWVTDTFKSQSKSQSAKDYAPRYC